MLWVIFIISFYIGQCAPQLLYKETRDISYQILGLFEKNAHTQGLAFNESMRNAKLNDYSLSPLMLTPERGDSYSVWRTLCSNDTIQPIAIVGPQLPISDGAIRDQCFIANIPHLQATWQPLDPDLVELNAEEENDELEEDEGDNEGEESEKTEEETPEEPVFKKISINFYPESDEISVAYSKILKYYKWESFAVLYEDDYGLLRIQKVLSEHTEQFPIRIRQLNPEGQNHDIFKELVRFQESRILLDCHVDRVLNYLKEADTLGMMNFYQHYILMSIDVSTLVDKLIPYKSNITWMSLTNYEKLEDAQHYLANRVQRWKSHKPSLLSPPVTDFETEALLMDDVAKHVLKALETVDSKVNFRSPINSICEEEGEPWRYGAALQNEILKTRTVGVTGNIEFDENGKRVNYTMYVNEIHVSKKQTVGRWESINPDAIIEDRPNSNGLSSQQSSKNFVIISRKAKPYFFDKPKCVKEDCTEEDNEKYEGFSVDLVKAIFKILREEGFDYTYTFFDYDKEIKYGKYDPTTKKWDGLIGDLLDKKADLAVCDLTITEERKKVIDFSVPFMSLGISILYTKERKIVPGTFSFLNPYSFEVWMHTATAYCVVSIILFVCSRISPADWENPQPCDKDPEELENIWNFKNCTWLTMGSIMTQGCDILPKAIGSRWVCGMWWFFAMIVCQTYIAQLAASMTSASENEPINSIEDLANQNKILYGAISGGSTLDFFKNSKDKMYRKMYENMMANPVVLVENNEEGEKRVLKGKNKYAFFMESSTIEYKLKRNCELQKVGGELDSKDYGIGMPANSPFRSQINTAILKLKELTILNEIKTKWWETKYDAIECPKETDENDLEGDLEMENLIGLFLVLIVGLVFCMFITAVEFMNEVRNIVVREQVTHKEAFIKELKASLNFFQLQKPVLRNPSRAPSIVNSLQSEEKHKHMAIENFLDFEKEVH